MSQEQLFPTGSLNAYQQYVQGLSNALMLRDWVYDPSFSLASDQAIYIKVMRDPVAAHAIRYRKHLVAGPEWAIEPASEEPEDKQVAAIIEELIDRIHGFTDSRICLADAIFRGSAYAFVNGRRRLISLAGGEPLAWWVPEKLTDVDRRRFRLVNENGVFVWQIWSWQRFDWETLEHPEWFVRSVFENTEDSLGYGRGLLDTLYYFQASKARLLQDGMAASERFGQGFLKAAIENLRGPDGRPVGGDGRSADQVATEWAKVLNKHRARNVLVHDKRDEVDILTGFGEGWQLIQELIGYLDNAQVTSVLGATLPTIQGDGGSFAMAKVQENSTEALVQADRSRLSDDLTRDLVGLLWSLNRFQFADLGLGRAKMPRFKIKQQKRSDPAISATVIATLLASGVELRADEVYSQTGFTPPAEDEATISPKEQPVPGLEGLDIGELGEEQVQEPVSALALNGAQISALVEIAKDLAADQLPLQTAVELATVSIPSLTREQAQKMLQPAAVFTPAVQASASRIRETVSLDGGNGS